MRTAALALAAALVMGTSACGGSTPPAARSSGPSGCDAANRSQCYPLPTITPAYCYVLQVRQMLRDGQLHASSLPRWASPADRDGAPAVIDFRRPQHVDLARRQDQLDRILTARHLTIDEAAVQHCIASTTDSDLVTTEGGGFRP
ncbi:hypothetical protein GCM10028801_29840 [Nocardioides maradonensis]